MEQSLGEPSLITRLVLYLAALCAAASCAPASSSDRVFKAPPGYRITAGYAEVVLDSENLDRMESYHIETSIWFKGPYKYRIASFTQRSVAPKTTTAMMVEVRNGRFLYSTFGETLRPHSRWYALPASMMDQDSLDIFLAHSWKIENPRLIGREGMLGLPVEHWAGVRHAKKGLIAEDLWVSTDTRFPFAMKVKRRSEWSHFDWQITKLDLDERVPNYLFTAQTFPQGGWHVFILRYRSPGMAIAWYALLQIALGGLILSLSKPRGVRRLSGALISLAAVCFILSVPPDVNTFSYQAADIPVMLAFALLTAAFVVCMVRLVGIPGNVRLFRGTTWFPIALALVALAIGVLWQYLVSKSYARQIGLSHWHIRFLGMPVLNVMLRSVASVTMEELVFRGYLFNALAGKFKSVWPAILLQAVIFGLYHLPSRLPDRGLNLSLASGIGLLCFYGLVFGILRWRYRNLGASWLVHFAFLTGMLYMGSCTTAAFMKAGQNL